MNYSYAITGMGIGLLILAVLAAGCTTPASPVGGTPSPVPTATGGFPGAACGFSTCHGLDLSCSSHPPEVCTALYTLGDKCRQYAACESSGGSCHLITTPQFEACRACVQRCGGADATEISTCEEKC